MFGPFQAWAGCGSASQQVTCAPWARPGATRRRLWAAAPPARRRTPTGGLAWPGIDGPHARISNGVVPVIDEGRRGLSARQATSPPPSIRYHRSSYRTSLTHPHTSSHRHDAPPHCRSRPREDLAPRLPAHAPRCRCVDQARVPAPRWADHAERY